MDLSFSIENTCSGFEIRRRHRLNQNSVAILTLTNVILTLMYYVVYIIELNDLEMKYILLL